MKGSIRVIAGVLVVFGVCGGLDTASDSQLLTLIVFGALGLGLMASGTNAMKESV